MSAIDLDGRKLYYRGYGAVIYIDSQLKLLVGDVAGIRDSIRFEGETAAELIEEFHKAVDSYLGACEELGKEPEVPRTRTISFRTTPQDHYRMFAAATIEGLSLKAWMTKHLIDAASRTLGAPKPKVKPKESN
jgi:predicted HicB family RNase H-like nuclease